MSLLSMCSLPFLDLFQCLLTPEWHRILLIPSFTSPGFIFATTCCIIICSQWLIILQQEELKFLSVTATWPHAVQQYLVHLVVGNLQDLDRLTCQSVTLREMIAQISTAIVSSIIFLLWWILCAARSLDSPVISAVTVLDSSNASQLHYTL